VIWERKTPNFIFGGEPIEDADLASVTAINYTYCHFSLLVATLITDVSATRFVFVRFILGM
jgi:hypothetical protein